MLQEEVARRAEVEEKLADAQGDLETADYQLVLLQDGEEHLDNINKLEKRVKELEEKQKELQKKNKDLQSQLGDQQDQKILLGHLESANEHRMLSLRDRLEDNVQNLANLTLVAECYRDLANRTLKTWMESDSLRVDELQELLDRLPEKHQRAIRKEDFTLIPSKLRPEKCALGDLLPPVETEEVLEAHAAISSLYPPFYPEESKGVLQYKRPRSSE